jgi:hypothetical protein
LDWCSAKSGKLKNPPQRSVSNYRFGAIAAEERLSSAICDIRQSRSQIAATMLVVKGTPVSSCSCANSFVANPLP